MCGRRPCVIGSARPADIPDAARVMAVLAGRWRVMMAPGTGGNNATPGPTHSSAQRLSRKPMRRSGLSCSPGVSTCGPSSAPGAGLRPHRARRRARRRSAECCAWGGGVLRRGGEHAVVPGVSSTARRHVQEALVLARNDHLLSSGGGPALCPSCHSAAARWQQIRDPGRDPPEPGHIPWVSASLWGLAPTGTAGR